MNLWTPFGGFDLWETKFSEHINDEVFIRLKQIIDWKITDVTDKVNVSIYDCSRNENFQIGPNMCSRFYLIERVNDIDFCSDIDLTDIKKYSLFHIVADGHFSKQEKRQFKTLMNSVS